MLTTSSSSSEGGGQRSLLPTESTGLPADTNRALTWPPPGVVIRRRAATREGAEDRPERADASVAHAQPGRLRLLLEVERRRHERPAGAVEAARDGADDVEQPEGEGGGLMFTPVEHERRAPSAAR